MSFRSRNCLPFAITCSLSSPRLVLSVAYPSQAPVLWVLLVWCCLLLTLHKHLFSVFSPFGVVCCLPFTSTCSLGSPRLVLSVACPSQAPVLWVLPVWCCLLLTLRKHLFSGFSPFGVVCCLPFTSICSLGSPRSVLSVAYPSQAPVLWVLPVWCCLLLTLRKHLFSGFSPFGVVCVAHLFTWFSVLCFVFLRPVSCVPNVVSVSGLSNNED
jgi:hypothetical protein